MLTLKMETLICNKMFKQPQVMWPSKLHTTQGPHKDCKNRNIRILYLAGTMQLFHCGHWPLLPLTNPLCRFLCTYCDSLLVASVSICKCWITLHTSIWSIWTDSLQAFPWRTGRLSFVKVNTVCVTRCVNGWYMILIVAPCILKSTQFTHQQMHYLLNLEKYIIFITIHTNIAHTFFGPRPSSGSLYWTWLKLYLC